MSDKYILDGQQAVRCADLMTWARWFEQADRHVAESVIDDVRVSTVFLGLDHSFGRSMPVLYETMVFGGPHDQEQERYATWEEAALGHDAMVNKVRQSCQP